MLTKTHFLFALFLALLLFPYVSNKIIFIPVVLIASLIPDMDYAYSYLGRKRFSKIFQIFTKHRGIMHSLTLCLILSALLSIVYPPLGLPFFLGYCSHLFFDSITKTGIRPFWPSKASVSGSFKTGGLSEMIIFAVLCLCDLVLVVIRIR